MKAKVNENAYRSWLEPYIGWEFPVKKVTKKLVHFWMDKGNGRQELFNHNKDLFDLNPGDHDL